MATSPLVGPDGSITDADWPTVSKRIDPYIPPAQPFVTARMAADAAAPDSDQIVVFVLAATAPACAGLGEVSPIRARGVAVRIRYADLTNSPPPPVDVRLGGPCCTTGGDHG